MFKKTNMKQYSFIANTPLKFHKFFWFVSLPLSFINEIRYFWDEFSGLYEWNFLYLYDYIFYVVDIVLIVCCFVGFCKWAPYGWYCMMAHLSLFCLDNFIGFALYVVIAKDMYPAIGRLLGTLLTAIPIAIYYWKRRPLFFRNKAAQPGAEHAAPVYIEPDPVGGCDASSVDTVDTTDPASEASDDMSECPAPAKEPTIAEVQEEASALEASPSQMKKSKIRYCRKCGSKLPPDSEYCNKCGTKIIKE